MISSSFPNDMEKAIIKNTLLGKSVKQILLGEIKGMRRNVKLFLYRQISEHLINKECLDCTF